MATASTRSTGTQIEERLKKFFEVEPNGPVSVYLFGSVARGTDTSRSDVDVAILFPQSPPKTYDGLPLRLEGELEKLLGRPVQVVVLNHAAADLRHRVLRDGKLILDRDRSFRIRFEVQTRNEYFDLQPILQRYRRFPENRHVNRKGVR